MGVRLVWATPNGEALIAEMAREIIKQQFPSIKDLYGQ